MSISTHVLDVSLGKPAAGIAVSLEREEQACWKRCAGGATDQDGRCRSFSIQEPLLAGRYRLIFDTFSYFELQPVAALYPEIVITFSVRNPNEHHHIPLLLAPNGYTTYRGT